MASKWDQSVGSKLDQLMGSKLEQLVGSKWEQLEGFKEGPVEQLPFLHPGGRSVLLDQGESRCGTPP